MKRIFIRVLIIFFTLLFGCEVYAAETYTIDPNHSYVLWHISHFEFSHPSGKWMVAEGTLNLDKEQPQNSKVNVTIHVADMITGIPALDKHLKGQLFFDVEKYPNATFVSDKITKTGKDTAKIHGILTIRGVSKPITLDVKLNKMGISPITNKETVGFTASTTLKRSDFGITTLLPGLGDDVKIDIEAEASKG
ncbi:MAG: polyisoprenoid-binding protein [Gammaproteobacteria bacterium]|nr:polyisoprenoid-binding protein [Gammaproteobacteria bacterium]